MRRFAPDGVHDAAPVGMPLATYHLAVHAGTGRWVLAFHQLGNGDPLTIAGQVVSRPETIARRWCSAIRN